MKFTITEGVTRREIFYGETEKSLAEVEELAITLNPESKKFSPYHILEVSEERRVFPLESREVKLNVHLSRHPRDYCDRECNLGKRDYNEACEGKMAFNDQCRNHDMTALLNGLDPKLYAKANEGR